MPNICTNDTLHKSLAHLAPIPEKPEPVLEPGPVPIEEQEPHLNISSSPPPSTLFDTEPNEFDIFKRFPWMPQRMVNKDSNSDNYVDNPRIILLRSACDTYSDPTHSFTTGFQKAVTKVKKWFWPF